MAELRLWLALIIDADYTRDELHVRREPLLPHFSFMIRRGDSLVQEVGGVDLRRSARGLELPAAIKRRITRLKNEKLKFYANDPSCQFKTEAAVRSEEVSIFRDLLAGRAAELRKEAERLMRLQAQRPTRQRMLDGTLEDTEHQLTLDRQTREAEIARLMAESQQVEQLAAAVRRPSDVFVWDIAFVEIFEGEKGGFDVVIGNPPYVRQENIADPRLPREKITNANKKEYKAKLARSVYQLFPRFFGYNPAKATVAHKLDAKSDLYVYFYFHGLSLLNRLGTFCFITSNSWLDVGYGKDLQEFLLKHSRIKWILDNEVKRSFLSAEINTVISLFSAPDERKPDEFCNVCHFVMFRLPFEQILSPAIFTSLEAASERLATPEYRAFPVTQAILLRDGCEVGSSIVEQNRNRSSPSTAPKSRALWKTAGYAGDKWGAKYLRAPDVYWTILRKGADKLKTLGKVTEVRRGITTGVNDFFYLKPVGDAHRGLIQVASEGGWEGEIEKRFLRRVIRSPRECYSIRIPPSAGALAFWCHESKSELRGTAALEYIRYGEKQDYHCASTVASRKYWYGLPEQGHADLFWPRAFFERFMTYVAPEDLIASDRFFAIKAVEASEAIAMFMNTLVPYLWIELQGLQVNHGGIDTKVVLIEGLPVCTELDIDRSLRCLFDEITRRPIALVGDEIERRDRVEFDCAVLSQIGLTKAEVRSLHVFVAQSARARILKARRQPTKKGHGEGQVADSDVDRQTHP